MATLVDRIASTVTKPLTRELEVVGIDDLAAGFRRVDLRSSSPLTWAPGQKVQLHVKGFEFRTYTPFDWVDDRVSLLVALDATGPGTDAIRALSVGDRTSVFGPRGAMDLSKVPAGPVMVGDETSFALGAAWERAGSGAAAAHLYEVTHIEPSRQVAAAIGLAEATLVGRSPDGAHLADLVGRTVEAVRAHPAATLVLTGKAQTIRAIRGALKEAGLSPAVRVKAHWDPNRSGLD